MIKTIKNQFIDNVNIRNKLLTDEKWLKLTFQWRIDKIQNELGSGVKDCNCKKCYALRLVINQIIMLAFTFNVNELEYESEKLIHKNKHV
jgi:hypothetical protein